MEKIANDALSLWREEASRQIPQNFKVFRSLVAQAKDFAHQGKYDVAAVYGEMAAFYAAWKHCGLFVSPELEQVLLDIGKKVIPTYSSFRKSTSLPGKPKKILHIATTVQAIGGHSKMLCRWIQQDSNSCHSLVLTRQPRRDSIPKILKEAVNNSGGKIYKLNETIGSIISWAKRLREIAAEADLVVLHIHNYDVIPIIAFANKEQSPPVILLNHADHVFWLGAGISDVVANLRESGMHLAQKRRGIEAERNLLLPTILEPIYRSLNRTQAKQKLGLPEDSVVLLSIARAPKYKTIDGISFADAHVSLLKQHQNTILVVVGSGNREDWSDAIQQTQERIVVHPEREDTAIFYQAADIYVDSFPFVSTTSLLEAGSYGLPLVSRFPYSDESSIFGAVMPGLVGNLMVARNLEEYISVLSRLVEDEEFRLSQGEATRKKIVEMHWGSSCQQYLENLYIRTTLPPVKAPLAPIDQMFLSELDILVSNIHGGNDFNLDYLIQSNLTVMPLKQRLHNWFKLVKKRGFHNHLGQFGQFRLLIPEWFYSRYVLLRDGF